MACKEGKLDVVELIPPILAFSIDLNAKHVNGMTLFYLVLHFRNW